MRNKNLVKATLRRRHAGDKDGTRCSELSNWLVKYIRCAVKMPRPSPAIHHYTIYNRCAGVGEITVLNKCPATGQSSYILKYIALL